MSDDVGTVVRAEEQIFPLSHRGRGARVPSCGAGRKQARRSPGASFLDLAEELAESRKSTLGQLVEEISKVQPETGNLTSAIRVACARWLADQNAELRKLASLKRANAILLACPSPAFALSSSKKILAFNPAFQMLVRRQLPAGLGEETRPDLKLALDLNVADIFARLDSNGEHPVVTGFVIGAGDRRYRAQLNVVRAPVSEPELLLAFVFG